MKKIVCLMLAVLMMLSCAGLNVLAEPAGGGSGGGSLPPTQGGGGGGSGGQSSAMSVDRIIIDGGDSIYVGGSTITLEVRIGLGVTGPIKSLMLYNLSYDENIVEFIGGEIAGTIPEPYIKDIDENGEVVIAYENETELSGLIARLTFKSKETIDNTLIGYSCKVRHDDNGVEVTTGVGQDMPESINVIAVPPSNTGGGGTTSYTVKFETNGGSEISHVRVKRNKTVTEPTAPEKEGYTFDSWYTDKELITKYDFDTKVTKSFTLYAKWIENSTDTGTDKPEIVNPFIDVNESDWFYDAVMFAYTNGITKGVSETMFAPYDRVTRGQFITMLCRTYDISEMSGDNFTDCGNTYYTGYLAAAKQLGISSGVGDNKFAPDAEITREEMVTLLYNYLKSVAGDDEKLTETVFADSDKISDWAKTAVAFANSSGYVNGKGGDIFDPQGASTRAELAQIFYNIFSK